MEQATAAHASPPRRGFRSVFGERHVAWQPWAVAATVFALYSAYSLSRVRQLLAAGYDLGIFDQVLRSYARFQAPTAALKGIDYNILGDHFHPILVTLVPFYWVWDDARVLLLAQAALVAGSCLIVWRIARRRFATRTSTLLLVGYALGWPLQQMVDFDFHEIAFALPLLAWAFDALDTRSDRQLFAAALLLLTVREDLGAVVLMLALVRALRRPRWPAAVLGAIGMVGFALIVGVIIPAVNGSGFAYWDYSVLGSGAGDAVRTLLTNPGPVIAALFVPVAKTVTLLALFAPLLALPLLSPYTLVALPILVARFLSDRESLWTTHFHYSAPVWVILAIAAIDGLARLERKLPDRTPPWSLIAAWLIALIPVMGTLSTWRAFPLSRLVTGEAWEIKPEMVDQRRAIAAIPPDTCVSADDRMVPPLIRTNRVTVPGIDAPRVDYYLLNFEEVETSHFADGTSVRTADVYIDALAQGYTEAARFGDVVVLEAPDAAPSAECAP